jgi:hypothetical protein
MSPAHQRDRKVGSGTRSRGAGAGIGRLRPVRLPSGRLVRPRQPQGKLDKITRSQRRALLAWLNDRSVTYDIALARLKSKFGIVSSSGAVSAFWRRNCLPLQPPLRPQPLHLVIELRSGQPISVVVKK